MSSGKPYEPDLFAPQARHTNVPGEQKLCCTLVFGAGALPKSEGKHLSAVRNGNGSFTIALPRTYRHRTGVSFSWGKYPAGAVLFPVVSSDDSMTPAADGGGSITIETRTEAGVATDPPNGAELDVTLRLSNDILNDDQYGTP